MKPKPLTVAYGKHPKQCFDVYMPLNVTRDTLIIFMIHGGGWHTGDKAMPNVVNNKLIGWPEAIFISCNYRLTGDGATPGDMVKDVAAGLAMAQGMARSWGSKSLNFGLMAHSAGAHLAALLNSDKSYAQNAGCKDWLWTILLDSAAYNVVDIMDGRHNAIYDPPFGTDPKDWEAWSPLQQLEKSRGKPKPQMVIYSGKRGEGDADHAEEYYNALIKKRGTAQLYKIDMTHGDLNKLLGDTSTPETKKYTGDVKKFIAANS